MIDNMNEQYKQLLKNDTVLFIVVFFLIIR